MRLSDTKLAVLEVFFDSPQEEFYLSQIRKMVKLSLDTVHRSLCFWSGNGVLRSRKIGRMKLYKLAKSEMTKVMKRLLEVEHG